jgi:paraquat-inducible protein B
MSKPTNTIAIGAFVTGALIIFFSLAFYLGGGAFKKNTYTAVMVFDGSVKGLKIGAPVAFKGVQIGEVAKIGLVLDTDSYEVLMPVEVRISEDRIKKIGSNRDEDSFEHLLKRGMRAQLQLQSLLTGLLYIQLDFHPDSKQNYFSYETEFTQVPTIPTDLERISRNLQNLDFGKLFEGIESSVAAIDKILNDPETQALTGNVNQTLAAVRELGVRLESEIETLSPGVNSLVHNADETMVQLNRELPVLSADTQVTLEQLTATLATAQTALEGMDYILSDDSAVLYDIRAAAKDLGAAGRALQSLAETLETQPESLLKGKSPLGN